MGRIRDSELAVLAEKWSPVVVELLGEIGNHVWPPKKIRRSLFSRAELVPRFSVEGPLQREQAVVWAISHTIKPSTFDDAGNLSEGEREFWLVKLEAGNPPMFTIEGAQKQDHLRADRDLLMQGFQRARKEGPKSERYYGNKGPLSHP